MSNSHCLERDPNIICNNPALGVVNPISFIHLQAYSLFQISDYSGIAVYGHKSFTVRSFGLGFDIQPDKSKLLMFSASQRINNAHCFGLGLHLRQGNFENEQQNIVVMKAAYAIAMDKDMLITLVLDRRQEYRSSTAALYGCTLAARIALKEQMFVHFSLMQLAIARHLSISVEIPTRKLNYYMGYATNGSEFSLGVAKKWNASHYQLSLRRHLALGNSPSFSYQYEKM